MALKDLAIWNKKSGDVGEIDRFFDDFFSDFGRFSSSLFSGERFRSFSPKIDISDSESSVDINAELPGMDEKDVQVSLKEDILTIKGEKKNSNEKKEKDYYRVERSFGSFERSIRIPKEINADKIKASFKNGVLNISLPKSEKAKEKIRQIEVKAS